MRQRECAIVAVTSAPPSAPTPKHAESTPKVRGPALSVTFASTGTRTLKLNETDIKTTAIPVNTKVGRERRTYARPSRVPFQMVGRPRPASGKSSLVRIARSPVSTARKLAQLTAKHQPAPTVAITTPASAGPTMRAVLKSVEFG